MWSFSYTGRGIADASSAHEKAALEEITQASEKQLRDKPAAAQAHIRAAADFVKAIAKTSNASVSIVAEGWIEQDGHAGCTVSVSIAGTPAAEQPPE
jgi:hypothetical protein